MNINPASVDHHPLGYYEIRVKGHLEPRWADWFEGMTIAAEANGETLLSGLVVDQAALHGMLRKIRDLGMPLISVNRIETGPSDQPDRKTSI